MRRLILIPVLVLLCLPAVAWAGAGAIGDGALVLTGVNARTVFVQGRGLLVGHIDQGTLTVVNYDPDDRNPPQISGPGYKLLGDPPLAVYTGANITFLFPNGKYSLKLVGSGIDVSAVGKGTATAIGGGNADGTMSVNGGKAQPLVKLPITGAFGSGAGVTPTVASGQTPASKQNP
jgi:hypothetical protein